MPVAEPIIANSIAQSFLAEFEAQAPVTRKFLERLPEDKLTWKPHEKSMTAGQLAFHLATVPGAIVQLVQENPRQARSEFVFPQPASRDEILNRELFAVPRMSFLRDIMLSHWYQHRGQFSVYLRLLNVAVPATWGPSADEAPLFMQETAKVA